MVYQSLDKNIFLLLIKYLPIWLDKRLELKTQSIGFKARFVMDVCVWWSYHLHSIMGDVNEAGARSE